MVERLQLRGEKYSFILWDREPDRTIYPVVLKKTHRKKLLKIISSSYTFRQALFLSRKYLISLFPPFLARTYLTQNGIHFEKAAKKILDRIEDENIEDAEGKVEKGAYTWTSTAVLKDGKTIVDLKKAVFSSFRIESAGETLKLRIDFLGKKKEFKGACISLTSYRRE